MATIGIEPGRLETWANIPPP